MKFFYDYDWHQWIFDAYFGPTDDAKQILSVYCGPFVFGLQRKIL